ncbi:hypothetical protein G205_01598 [Arthrobacter nitrophenolicus]|uniref:Uncharacterized protein n=1 Tax=Arthrobacter nitrophenolicus TaxID=683150 RepID=L8TRG7_9MICC|nr:hypothetical protein G205_01598 [Arthrobacter nitrophenolicus]
MVLLEEVLDLLLASARRVAESPPATAFCSMGTRTVSTICCHFSVAGRVAVASPLRVSISGLKLS